MYVHYVHATFPVVQPIFEYHRREIKVKIETAPCYESLIAAGEWVFDRRKEQTTTKNLVSATLYRAENQQYDLCE